MRDSPGRKTSAANIPVSPEQQVRREAANFATGVIRQAYKNSGYSTAGASYTKRSLKGFIADSRSPVEDIDMNLFTLRQRSRQLYMESPIARSAIDTQLINVVGPGLAVKPRPKFKLLGMDRDAAREWEEITAQEFSLWADTRHCDATAVNNFFELQGLALVSWLMSGDAIALIDNVPVTPYMPYGLRIHLIESDRVTNPNTTAFSGLTGQIWYNTKNGNRVYNGVEIDKNGAIVAYHVANFYPNSFVPMMTDRKWARVDAFDSETGMENVIHVMYSERPEQYRGVPLLAPVIEAVKQVTRYQDAELVSSVVQSFFTAFIRTEVPTGGMPFESSVPEEARVDNSPVNYELGPGTVNRLGTNESVEFANPSHPSGNFDAFMTSISKFIGAAVGVPYELLLKSFNASYSASRASLLEAWKGFKTRRAWFARDFCQPIYEQFLAEAVARGRIQAPGFFDDPGIRKAWCHAEWNGPSQGQIDPLKEVMAEQMKVANGFTDYEKATTELTGGNWEQNMENILRENPQIAAAMAIYNPNAKPVPQAVTSAAAQPANGNGKAGGDNSGEGNAGKEGENS